MLVIFRQKFEKNLDKKVQFERKKSTSPFYIKKPPSPIILLPPPTHPSFPVFQGKNNKQHFLKISHIIGLKVEKVLDTLDLKKKKSSIKSPPIIEYFFDFLGP